MKLRGIRLRTVSHGKDEGGGNMAVNYGYGCSEIKTKKCHKGVEKVPFLKRIQMEDFLFLTPTSELQCGES